MENELKTISSNMLRCGKCQKLNFESNIKLINGEELTNSYCYKCHYLDLCSKYDKLVEQNNDLNDCMKNCMITIYQYNAKHKPEFDD